MTDSKQEPLRNPDKLSSRQIGAGWRLVGALEELKDGDEFWNGDGWEKCYDTEGRFPFPDSSYRRRIDQPDDSASLRAQVATLQARVVELEARLRGMETSLDLAENDRFAQRAKLKEVTQQLAACEKFCASLLRQYDRLEATGQLKIGGTLLVVQHYEITALRAAMSPDSRTEEKQ